MADWYYYEKGIKTGPINSEQLKYLAKSGSILQDTIIETSDGRRVYASAINGLVFESGVEEQTYESQEPENSGGNQIPSDFLQKNNSERASQYKKSRRIRASGKNLDIASDFFPKTAFYCYILQWIVWVMCIIFYIKLLGWFMFSLRLFFRAENGIEEKIAGTLIEWQFTLTVIPATVGLFFVYIVMPLIVASIKLLGKFNLYLDNRINE